MVDILQRFSVGNLSRLLAVILAFWLIWPVLCGVLGAKRGSGLTGVMHGLFWGPLGLPIVLLSGRRHVCPTCGKRTLSRPSEEDLPAICARPVRHPASHRTPALSVSQPTHEAGEAALEARPVQPPPVLARPLSATAPDACAAMSGLDREDGSEEEEARLRAWVNGEVVLTAPSR